MLSEFYIPGALSYLSGNKMFPGYPCFQVSMFLSPHVSRVLCPQNTMFLWFCVFWILFSQDPYVLCFYSTLLTGTYTVRFSGPCFQDPFFPRALCSLNCMSLVYSQGCIFLIKCSQDTHMFRFLCVWDPTFPRILFLRVCSCELYF